jgi:hypothetical protein
VLQIRCDPTGSILQLIGVIAKPMICEEISPLLLPVQASNS